MMALNPQGLVVKTCCAIWLMALLVSGAAPLAAQGERLRFYGFFDIESKATNHRGGPPWTFDQHHFNVISIFNLDRHWRVFAEVEWEHGAHLTDGVGSGEVVLERAAVEYTRSAALQIKAGKFLPPFGLYNLRHDATPTFLATSLPDLYAEHVNTLGASQPLIPEFGTGVQVLGSVVTHRWQGEYFLYLVNGRGPAPGSRDNNPNKGVGGRVVLHAPGGAMQVGASYYADRNGDAADTRQRSLGVDVTVRHAEVLLEAEALVPRLEYVDLAGQPNGSFRTGRSYYVQLSRPVTGMMTPFLRYERYDPDTSVPRDAERDFVVGLNFAASGAVFLKNEVQFRSFGDPAQEGYQVLLTSVAVAF